MAHSKLYKQGQDDYAKDSVNGDLNLNMVTNTINTCTKIMDTCNDEFVTAGEYEYLAGYLSAFGRHVEQKLVHHD